ncbi:MAG: sugar transferase [Parcubacteria group bacterium]|nr:sugar transferase [Parcubacteria group bacterium]
MKKSELFFTVILLPIDFLMIFLAALISYFLRSTAYFTDVRPILFDLSLSKYLLLILFAAPFCLLIFAILGFYKISKRRFIDDLYGAFIGVTVCVAAFSFYIFLRAELFSSRFLIIVTWFLAILFVILGRSVIRIVKRRLYKYGIGVYRVVLIGNGSASKNLIYNFKKPLSGYKMVAHIKEYNESVLGSLKKISKRRGIDEIIQTDSKIAKSKTLEIKDFADEGKIDFKYIPDFFGTQATNIDVRPLAGFPLVELKRTPLDGWGRILKRSLDLVGSLFSIIIFSPLFLIVAIAIKIDSRGPVFVKLKRVGNQDQFCMYKFRSMIDNAHKMKKKLLKYSERKGPLFKMKDDPRITRVGRFLRKTRIDELPNFINVLKGEMSIVGPRAHEPEEVAQYKKKHKKVLAIKPGVTGMAQVSGGAELEFDDEVKLDTYYIENWSLKLDLQILFRTIVIVITGQKAAY